MAKNKYFEIEYEFKTKEYTASGDIKVDTEEQVEHVRSLILNFNKLPQDFKLAFSPILSLSRDEFGVAKLEDPEISVSVNKVEKITEEYNPWTKGIKITKK